MDKAVHLVIDVNGTSISGDFSSDYILRMTTVLQDKIDDLLNHGSRVQNLMALKRGVERLQTDNDPSAADVVACVMIGLTCLQKQDQSTDVEELLENDGLVLRIEEDRIEPVPLPSAGTQSATPAACPV